MGCIERIPETSVVRLGYEGDVTTARELKAEQLTERAFKPLLRSTNVLRALFHRGAVVTVGEADRVFYDEMNHRLDHVGRGVADALILNGQGKDSIDQLVLLLRQTGIPAAVVDLDVVGRSGTPGPAGTKLLAACGIPVDARPQLSNERAWLAEVLDLAPVDAARPAVKWGGIERLEGEDRVRAAASSREAAVADLLVTRWQVWMVSVGSRRSSPRPAPANARPGGRRPFRPRTGTAPLPAPAAARR
jgi:hypothetical protein